jgi:hypothetical protein
LFDEIVDAINRRREGNMVSLDMIRDAIQIFEITSYAGAIKIIKAQNGIEYAHCPPKNTQPK